MRAPTRRQVTLLLGVLIATIIGAFTVFHIGANLVDGAGAVVAETPRSDLPTVAVDELPAEARETLALIDRGGPYPYRQDNTVFSNVEGRLPRRPHGYYREYTVRTPGSRDRGARRLVVGADGDIYYTEDHYETFRQVIR